MVRGSDLIVALISLLFPPIGVAIIKGCGCDLLINICLTALGYIPGLIHALWLQARQMQTDEMNGQGSYRYAGHTHGGHPGHVAHAPPPPVGYGGQPGYSGPPNQGAYQPIDNTLNQAPPPSYGSIKR